MNDSDLRGAMTRAVEAKDFEAADFFYNQLEAKQQALQPEPTLQERRDYMGGGELSFGPFDTGIKTPQWLDETLSGVGRRMTEIGTLGFHKPDPKTDKMLDDSIPATIGGVATDIGALLVTGGVLGGKGAMAQHLTNPTSLIKGMGAAGAYGAATDHERLEGGAGAAIGQGIGYGLPKLLGKVVSPYVKKSASSLIGNGGTLTPGEILGGTTQRLEDAATSIPLLGDTIQSAKGRSLASYSKGVINDALESVGSKLDDSMPAGRAAIAKADDIISSKYDKALLGMNTKLDQQFSSEVSSLLKLSEQLPEKQQKALYGYLTEKVFKNFDNPNQLVLGKTFKEVDSALRKESDRWMESQDPFNQNLGKALKTVRKSFLDMGKRQNPLSGEALASADKAYAKMQRVSQAAGYEGAREGVFTPGHLLRAIKSNTSKKSYGAGKGFDQKATEAAKEMLAKTIPDSGTAPRAIMNTALLGGAYAFDPLLFGGLLGASGAYTKPGQKIVQAALTQRPPIAIPLRRGLEQSAPYTGLLGTSAGVNISQ
jgi:hypothetical protein